MFVYLDNAATTKPSKIALEAYLSVAEKYYGNPSSLHTVGQNAAEELAAYREKFATLLHCKAREITFLSGGSEADNHAIVSAAHAGAMKGKKHIVSTAIEHHAVLHTLKKLEKEGFKITLLPVPASGIVRIEDVKDALTDDTCLVSVMYANNEIGTIQPIEEIGKLLREKKILFHCDAVQAVGHLPIDLATLPVDYLALSAHKFGGVKGVGALYTKTGAPLFPFIEGGAQERGKRAGTENLPAVAAMTVA
ncbi:MAG: cysteine desulfurase, partial [Clostridiales bacterium]|nr:cysteine desulfurase [Clostridiales bacterium]